MKLPTKGTLRVLDFDIENMPLTYWIPDRPTAEVTAIAMQYEGFPDTMHVCILGEETSEQMLMHFVERYVCADMVTGHYIRKHDLPILNGALIEFGFDPLGEKLTSDTKLDLMKYYDLPKTQEHLSEMLGVKAPKVHMTQADWREANRRTPKGIAKTRKRAGGDVKQHIQLRKKLIDRGLLGPPKIWRP